MTDSLDRDYRGGLDQLQADMANHQRKYVGEVTATENQKLAVETIERIEKQDSEARLSPDSDVSAPTAEFDGSRIIDGREYKLERRPDKTPMYRTASEFEHQVMAHAMPRLELLLGKRDSGPLGAPSWRDRTMAAMYFKVKSLEAINAGRFDLAGYYERAYQVDLQELLDASSQPFGDWRNDAPKKIILG